MKWDKKQVKEMILTDYLDDRLDEATRRQLDTMIQRDPELQEFVREAREALQVPMVLMGRKQPPEKVWTAIREKIDARTAPEIDEEKPGFWEWWIELRAWARLSLSAATLALSVLIVAVTSRAVLKPATLAHHRDAQVEYLMLLVQGDPVPAAENGGAEGLGTSIENYFL